MGCLQGRGVAAKLALRAAGLSLAATVLLPAQSLPAAPSESERIAQLEREIAELKREVSALKKEHAPIPRDKMKTESASEGKTYVEKAVVEEKPPVYVQPRGPELKLVLGGFIQMNFEAGDVSAFEGRFGQTALDDRFRLRRARINLTGDFAEQFDFKIEGDFGQSDGSTAAERRFRLLTSLLTGTNSPLHKSWLANIRRHLDWSSLPRLLPCTLSSAPFRPAQSPHSDRSAFSSGESLLPAFGPSKRIY
jgi:hypothetical protein